MEKVWKLGIDLNECDNLLDGFTFEQVITALYCGEKIIDKKSVKRVIKEILESQLQDLNCLLENNMNEIIKRAKKGRE